ncbi:MAG: NAD-binding protein [Isosphaeraceae bacterium]|nr:NAD-binding protein [Isosphaeraceae bacterium]
MARMLKTRGRLLLRAYRSRQARRDAERAAWWEHFLRLNRYQLVRLSAAVVTIWVLGAVGIHLVERAENPAFATWPESLWSVWVIMFSGMEVEPKTTLGRLLSVLVLLAGLFLVGLFTGAMASVLVEYRLRRREVSHFEMEDHLVLCNWAPRGLEWISEVHSKIIQEKRPVVIIHDQPEAIDLPDKEDDPAFNDVYIVKGDPTNEIVLRRARVPKAHSVVVLSDDRQGEHADGKTILTCIALRNICRGEQQPNIAVECRNPSNRFHLRKAGADEIISSDELGLRLLARTALYHGMTRVYQELLTVGRDANEMYLLPVPRELVGRDFVEVASMFLRYRGDKRSALLIGLQREEEMILNPVGGEAGPLKPDDLLILLGRVFLNPSQPLPTVPPITPAPEGA